MNAAALPLSTKSAGDSASPQVLELRQHVDQRLIALRNERMSWWTHWREIADYLIPRRYKWLVTPNQGNRGSPINQRIIDNTGTVALRVLAAGMMSGITSPGRPWFRLTLDDSDLADDQEVKAWLDEVQKRMLHVFAESNFYNALQVLYVDLGAFGTSPMVIYEDFDDVIRCYNQAAGEYYVTNGPRMNVDTDYREFVLTVAQVAKEFGLENCSPTVQGLVRTGGAGLSREVKIGHAIEPNDKMLPGAPGIQGMAWREIYWELGSGQNYLLRVRGFHECPFVCPRWDIIGNDAYGRSPAMDALGDVKMLQVEQKRKAQAIDKHVNPPLLADISLKNEPASVLPGGVTYVAGLNTQGGVGMRPVYQVAPDFSGLLEDIKEVQERVKVTFFSDLFMMISQLDTVRTATEIDARREEKLIQLGPVLERFENEALDPAIERTFAIMDRGGLLPPKPPALQGQYVKVEYISMLAEAQRAVSTAAIERVVAFVGNLTAVDPNAIDNIDVDETIDLYADLMGVSPKVIRAARKVAAIRQQKQQAAQQQQQMEQTMAGVQGAQTLSQTDVGGGANALQKIMGNA